MDISSKLDKELVERYTEVAIVMAELNIPFLVVGASARDLFFEYAYGIASPSRTHDLDFAIQVPNWEKFEQTRKALIKRGFEETNIQHRLRKGKIYPIDIVPFGEIADENNIVWPPDGDTQMNVLGFDEVLSNAVTKPLTPIEWTAKDEAELSGILSKEGASESQAGQGGMTAH